MTKKQQLINASGRGCFGNRRAGQKAEWKLQKRHDAERIRKARIKMNRGGAL